MSDSSKPWSNNPYAPPNTYGIFLTEKAFFSGSSINAILYGIIVVLFFKCMHALLEPVGRAKLGIRWALVAHTMATFLAVTICNAASINIESVSYIDNRGFRDNKQLDSGPFAFLHTIMSDGLTILANFLFYLGQWLADGLLLYRCYIVYNMNCWVIAPPCLMYLATVAVGIILCYYNSQLTIDPHSQFLLSTLYYSISLSLNALLTSMIIGRLILHSRNLRRTTGTRTGVGKSCKIVVTMFAESYVLYAVSYTAFLGTWGAASPWSGLFAPLLPSTQAIAPLLIILRVANRTALTGPAVTSQDARSMIRFGSQGESTDSAGALSDDNPIALVDIGTGIHAEPAVGAKDVTEGAPRW